MDHARSFDFVQQLPRKTITEVHTSDMVYSHQVLLNETWENYCKRRNVPHRAQEVHEKWITETWDEYLQRAVVRSKTLADFDADNDAKIAAREAADDQRAEIGRNVVDLMMAAEKRRIEQTRIPHSLTLLLDFEELRQQRFARERLAVEDEEAAKRQWVLEEMETERQRLIDAFEAKRQEMIAAAEAKRLAEEEARRQEEEALRKAEEERKAAEEAKRRAELEAERRRRAEEEEAKRAERKRKEDERRAKAKAEREARNRATTGGGGAARLAAVGDAAESAENKGRAQRIKRMHDSLPGAIEQARALAASSETIEEYCSKLVEMLGNGALFFHTGVYIGVVSSAKTGDDSGDATQQLQYIAASANCSDKLTSGAATLDAKDSSSFSAMLKNPKALPHIGPVPIAAGEGGGSGGGAVVQVGDGSPWPPTSGEAAFFPITISSNASAATKSDGSSGADDGAAAGGGSSSSSSSSSQLWGVLAIDTASSNTVDPVSTFQSPEEDGCYQSPFEGSAERLCNEPVNITPEVVSFLDELAGITSSAAATLPSLRNAQKAFDFDLDLLRAQPNLGKLLATFTHLTRKALSSEQHAVDCYVSIVSSSSGAGAGAQQEALVVAHNGYSIVDGVVAADVDDKAPHHLVGGKITEGSAKTFGLPTKAGSSEFVPDVAADTTCVMFDKALNNSAEGEQKKPSGETLLLIPIVAPKANPSDNKDATDEQDSLWGAVGISSSGGGGLSEEVVPALVELFWNHVRPLILAMLKRAALLSACQQAIEWLNIATGCDNVYIALTHSRDKTSSDKLVAAPLEIVKASASQQFLEGKTWAATDGGISHHFVGNAAGHTHEANATAQHFATLKKQQDNSNDDDALSNIKFWNDSIAKDGAEAEKAQLVMCAIAQNKPDAKVHGILYGDTLYGGNKKKSSTTMKDETISSSDVDVFRLTAQLLAATLDNDQDISTTGDKKKLAIETDSSSSSNPAEVAFLSRLFDHATQNVRGITNSQLQELARYPAPPPVIPTTVASAVVLLGSSKASTEWADVRKKIKQTLIDNIAKFDPTSKKVKKSCVIRAKNLTKGLTASDVFTKGSHPASCLFTWVFISLLLRKFSKTMRDRGGASDSKERVVALLAAGSGGTTVAADEDEDEKEGEEEAGADDADDGADEDDADE